MKLHIGCGEKYLPGYTHVDVRKYDHIDYITSADNLAIIADESVSEIYACHILEHFPRHQTENVLLEWKRVIHPGGLLRLAVPDFAEIVAAYNELGNLNQLIGLLYGGQNYDYNYHYRTFDMQSLSDLLKKVGFSHVERYRWQDFLPNGYDDFSRAYIPHMQFDSGRLMSLNVIAY